MNLRVQLLIVACVNIGQFIDGYSVGWSAPIIPKLQDLAQSPLPNLVTDFEVSWIGSLLYVGAIVGPYIPSYLSNIIGRKPCLFLGGLFNLIAILLIVVTKNVATVFALRIISGLGMGMVTVSNLVYVGEIASTNIRGILLTSTSIVGIFGTLAAYTVGSQVSYAMTGYFALIINIIHIVGICFIPESPVYYAIKESFFDFVVEPILLMMLRFRGETIAEIMVVIVFIACANCCWWWHFKIRLMTCPPCVRTQTHTMEYTLFYLIGSLAIISSQPDLATIIIGGTRLLASCVAPFVVERAGRRILLLFSTAFCAVSLAVLGLYFYMSRFQHTFISELGWLPLFALIMYFFSYEIGFGTMPTALVGEMFKGNARSTGSAVSMTTAWLIGFGVATGFGTMVSVLGGDVTFWIFSASCIVALCFTYKFVPETKGKSLNEIQEILSR